MTTIPSTSSTSSPDAARDELDAFARFCARTLTTEAARSFVLEDFQRTFLQDYFAGSRELVVLLPKKNGKSSVLGALSLYHLLTTPFAEVVVVAASRDQAGILLRQVVGFIRRSNSLTARLTVKQREIVNERLGGRIRILASDSDTVDGQLPTLVIVDELHRHRTPALYGILRDGLGPRGGRMVTISTSGDDEGSPLGQLRTRAHAMPGGERHGAHLRVSDEHFSFHEWALQPDADVDDLAVVLEANPASWIDAAELRRRRTPSMRPWSWKRFTCGIWVSGENSAISDVEWRACARLGLEISGGVRGVFCGVDLGWKHDSTAIVPVWRPPGEDIVQVHTPTIIVPPGDGTSTPVDDVFAACEEFADRWPTATFVIDPAADGEHLAQRLDAELPNVTVATMSQKHGPMCLAASRLSEAIAAGRLEHPDDEVLNQHVMAAAARSVGEQWRFSKQRGKTALIDGVIALAMAHSALLGEDQRPTYSRQAWQT